jgi:hypothetical protein
MATKRRFEIRPATDGFEVFAYTSGDFGSAGGLARMASFDTQAAAKAWVREQFEVPAGAWQQVGQNLVAVKE